MKPGRIAFVILLVCVLGLPCMVFALDLNGVWTKTTSSDPENITIFYQDAKAFQALGHSRLKGKNVVWSAVGQIEDNHVYCYYQYSPETVPPGWEPGIMRLKASSDGNVLTGIAESVSGKWKGNIRFQRLR